MPETKDILLVFSDDWGVHPSSCQHLVRRLLPVFDVYWVNTIGTRRPRLDRHTFRRGWRKVRSWLLKGTPAISSGRQPVIVNPVMWPSFTTRLARGVNRRLVARAVRQALPEGRRIIAVTTLPIVADLIGNISVSRWVYYCVDDLSHWPGLDKESLERMERDLVDRVDVVVAVSTNLVDRIAAMGRPALLLTHGVEMEHWKRIPAGTASGLESLSEPRVIFWGVLDPRLDVECIRLLSEELGTGCIVLLGPENNPDKALDDLPNVHRPGVVAYEQLPLVARQAAVLIMPYRDLPATRAMQPLKLKEYLASRRPVVCTALPALDEWKEACDVVESPRDFVAVVVQRIASGVPESQLAARARLEQESWSTKATAFRRVLLDQEA